MKESIKDLPNHDYDSSLPTCWILEGLVMYLSKNEVIKLLTELTSLSAKGSYIILHYINNGMSIGNASDIGHMAELLKEKGWSNEKIVKFGSDEFNYGRFQGSEPIENWGFAFYTLE